MNLLRVLSYNIHKGFTSGKKFVLDDLRDTIQDVQADLVILQEVIGFHEVYGRKFKNWPTSSQFEYLADKTWPHHAYGKNAVYINGHHGNAILSKFPFTFWENINISKNRLENRGLLHGTIEIPGIGGSIHVICIHLALFESWREAQIEFLCERIDSHVPHDAPLIVAGDFNDWRERATMRLSERLDLEEVFLNWSGDHARTFPIWFPILKLDRVYSRGLEVEDAVCLTKGPWKRLSDHAALCVDFSLGRS